MNNNNDPFKKMDLNFDPTVEAKVETPKEKGLQTSGFGEEVKKEINQQQTKIDPLTNLVNENEPNISTINEAIANDDELIKKEAEKIGINEYKINENIINDTEISSASQSTTGNYQVMEKTLEYRLQEEHKFDVEAVEKDEKYIKNKKLAHKHKRSSYYWVVIALLSIFFGASSIVNFALNTRDFIHIVKQEDAPFFQALIDFVLMFGSFFEAFLFAFFIFFSIKRYTANHKPWMEWWHQTEPIRIIKELNVQIFENAQNRDRANSLAIPFLPKEYTGTTNKEQLAHISEENKILVGLIKREEHKRKTDAKIAKKS